MKFDKDAPFGIITPPENGAHYWQNGQPFDHEYNHIDGTGKIIEYFDKAPPIKKKKGASSAPASAPAPSPSMTEEDEGEDDQSGLQMQTIDLVAWANGADLGPGIIFADIQTAMIDAGYDIIPDKADDAKAIILAKEGP